MQKYTEIFSDFSDFKRFLSDLWISLRFLEIYRFCGFQRFFKDFKGFHSIVYEISECVGPLACMIKCQPVRNHYRD